eukprot:108052-Pyramimonas_sp.AAC.1
MHISVRDAHHCRSFWNRLAFRECVRAAACALVRRNGHVGKSGYWKTARASEVPCCQTATLATPARCFCTLGVSRRYNSVTTLPLRVCHGVTTVSQRSP